MHVVHPQTPAEFEQYYTLRYEVLRKPWKQPWSTVKDDQEETSFHAMIVDEEKNVLGVCRMQYNTSEEAQLRFMGIRSDMQGKRLGKLLLDHFENMARVAGMKRIILHARENAVSFYQRNGYVTKEKSYLMWGEIQHYLMEKGI
jgi:N-acetylglutamate synthase-like GNAT family acetyltransferase